MLLRVASIYAKAPVSFTGEAKTQGSLGDLAKDFSIDPEASLTNRALAAGFVVAGELQRLGDREVANETNSHLRGKPWPTSLESPISGNSTS